MATDDHWLDGRAILVVEDVYRIADDLCRALESNGARIVGPTARLIDALQLADHERIDGAVPFVFATGYDADALAPEWQSAGRVEKPFSAGAVVSALRQATTMSGQPA